MHITSGLLHGRVGTSSYFYAITCFDSSLAKTPALGDGT